MKQQIIDVTHLISGYKLLEKTSSKYNGEIEVVKQFGELQVKTGNITQSGDALEHVWKNTLSAISGSREKSFLILGLGSGTLASMLLKKFPKSHVVGVEIDQEMIKIGSKYMDINKFVQTGHLTIVLGDAAKFISTTNSRYDYIFVDLYVGRSVPSKLDSAEFLKKLILLLDQGGTAFINRLFYDTDTKTFAEKTISKLKKVKDIDIKLTRSFTNVIITVSRSGNRSDKEL